MGLCRLDWGACGDSGADASSEELERRIMIIVLLETTLFEFWDILVMF